jgi:Spy/CpxP family protein refolding chaperone
MDREVKALSKEETAGLLEGRGLGMALSAELNGYPGPMHVLELKEGLGLFPEQVTKTEELFRQVKAEAKALGSELVEAEKKLDSLFKDKNVNEQNLSEATALAGSLRGRLRETHLKYHIRMLGVLSPEQVAKYNELRGYSIQ